MQKPPLMGMRRLFIKTVKFLCKKVLGLSFMFFIIVYHFLTVSLDKGSIKMIVFLVTKAKLFSLLLKNQS